MSKAAAWGAMAVGAFKVADGGLGVAEGEVAARSPIGMWASRAWIAAYAGLAAEGAREFAGGYDRIFGSSSHEPSTITGPATSPAPAAVKPDTAAPLMTVESRDKNTTSSVGKLAQTTGHTAKDIKRAIHGVKNEGGWRGLGANRNPDVEVDPSTGEVYPKSEDGVPSDESIGNIYDYLPDEN